jgi:hypothetical protein
MKRRQKTSKQFCSRKSKLERFPYTEIWNRDIPVPSREAAGTDFVKTKENSKFLSPNPFSLGWYLYLYCMLHIRRDNKSEAIELSVHAQYMILLFYLVSERRVNNGNGWEEQQPQPLVSIYTGTRTLWTHEGILWIWIGSRKESQVERGNWAWVEKQLLLLFPGTWEMKVKKQGINGRILCYLKAADCRTRHLHRFRCQYFCQGKYTITIY